MSSGEAVEGFDILMGADELDKRQARIDAELDEMYRVKAAQAWIKRNEKSIVIEVLNRLSADQALRGRIEALRKEVSRELFVASDAATKAEEKLTARREARLAPASADAKVASDDANGGADQAAPDDEADGDAGDEASEQDDAEHDEEPDQGDVGYDDGGQHS